MKNVRTAIVAALLATSLVAAGCGSDDDSSSTSTPAASTASAPTEATSTPTTASTPTDTGSTSTPTTVDAAVQAGIESCKQSIAAQPTISDSVKSKLDKVCDKITDANGVAAAVKEVCTTIVSESNIPDGAAKDQALAACDATAPTP
jgi:PBP1b-binding outer membrane lipoprotein LpoB